MPGDEVIIELSVEDSNELRAKLGLQPLRLSESTPMPSQKIIDVKNEKSSNEINLSIEESNALRSKLGLSLLKLSSDVKPSGKKPSDAIHAPALNTRDEDAIRKRIEETKLKREVEAGVARMKDYPSSNAAMGSMLDWAQKMRENKNELKSQKKHFNTSNVKNENALAKEYTSNNFVEQDITVVHSSKDFETGTTILTLADKSILDTEEDENENTLENVNMTDNAKLADNLKRKRMVESGIGHAGGYAGYDDDEFEESGGSLKLGMHKGSNDNNEAMMLKKKGFKLTDKMFTGIDNEEKRSSELFNSLEGKSITLLPTKTRSLQVDFMTNEDEEQAIEGSNSIKAELEKRRKKKEKKLLKKLKKQGKGVNKESHSEIDVISNGDNKARSLLETLEESNLMIDKVSTFHRNRKRRRTSIGDSDDEGDDENRKENQSSMEEDVILQTTRKKKFDSIMEKGNLRTDLMLNQQSKVMSKPEALYDDDDNDDDEFLSAALSKARRMNRLKDLNTKEIQLEANSKSLFQNRGADAVVQSINLMKTKLPVSMSNDDKREGTVTFQVDTTKDFTRMFRSQNPQVTKSIDSKKKNPRKADDANAISSSSNNDDITLTEVSITADQNPTDSETQESLIELASQVKDDHHDRFGDTASTLPVGRGMSTFVSMLKHTGDITGKNAGKEELRGRAKDERNYEDYENLNLKEIVKLDTSSRSLHEKDLEFANREIKLEYRDEHGRLLTRKEAYRNLCYQFHGHGSSKKNEEKRLKQIERERAEASLASKHDSSGTLGALKATQRATGKAFVLHKT